MSYQRLRDRFQRIGDLAHASAMLSWDDATLMPSKAGAARADALATLAGLMHEHAAAEEVGDWMAAAADEDLDPWQAANVALIERRWRRARALPNALAVALSKASSRCEQAWRPARAANDWPAVARLLRTVLDLTRQKAQALADAEGCAPYDALLGEYEPGLRRERVEPLFAQLRAALPPLIDRALGRQGKPLPIAGPFPAERQHALGQSMMRALGFDLERGSLSVSKHPFCGGVPDDTRITTRYNEADFLESMFAVLHETGHGLYQQGLPAAWRGQPVGEACGMALHESQSLLMEMQVCRGRPFLDFAAPIIQRRLLGAQTSAAEWQPTNLAALATEVKRGFIRVDSDELTYPLHVALRYELETALLDGDLDVDDVPEGWDDAMRRYLGLSTGGDFANGCMQDVHWFAGLIGYFPCYTMGAVIAAQIYRTAAAGIGDLDDAIRAGELGALLAWLRANIHERGQRKPTLEVVRDATGGPVEPDAFLAHLDARYGAA